MDDTRENNRTKPGRDSAGRFLKGNSGFAKGRPRGSHNKTTLMAQALINNQAPELVQQVITTALAGDTVCLKLCLERLVPVCKDRPVQVSLPELKSPADVRETACKLMKLVAEGQITTREGNQLAELATTYLKATELIELEARLKAIEDRLGGAP